MASRLARRQRTPVKALQGAKRLSVSDSLPVKKGHKPRSTGVKVGSQWGGRRADR